MENLVQKARFRACLPQPSTWYGCRQADTPPQATSSCRNCWSECSTYLFDFFQTGVSGSGALAPKKSEGLVTESARQIWAAALGQLQLEIPRPNYETWLRPTSAVELENEILTISTPSPFAAEMLEKRLSGTIHRTVSKVAGRKIQIVFSVRGANGNEPEPTKAGEVQTVNKHSNLYEKTGEHIFEGADPDFYTNTYSLKDDFSFDKFVVAPSNRLAQAAAAKVSESPGSIYNPLYIYSEVGLGKTHLLHAIGHELSLRGLKVIYVSSERFTNEYIASIRNGTTEDFRERYRGADALLIDDIQFITTKPQTQEGFFHTFNELHMAGKQIVVTGDEPATKSLLQERIQSRLAGGLEVDIQAPDYESRYAILQSKAPDCDAEVLDRIARLSHQNVRELEGALNRVVAYSQLVGEPVSSEIAEVALKSLVPDGSDDEVTADQVLQAVADYTGVDVEAMMGKKRDKSTSEARRMAMYLLREDAHLTSNRVGKALGGKDHSTVLYAQKRFEQLLETDTSLRGQLSSVRDIMQRSKRTSTISN